MSNTKFTIADDKKTLIAERTFQAPKSKVWEAYTKPEILAKWWGPKGWETEIKHMDFTEGGYWHYGMKCVDPEQKEWFGQVSWGKGTYEQIDPEDSFAYTDAFCDENAVETPGMPTSRTVVKLEERGDATTLTSTSEFESPEALKTVIDMGMEEGFDQTWDNLEAILAQ